MAARFFSMFMIRKWLQSCFDGYNGIKTRNGDRVICISGYEGLGKSNLGMHIFEQWYTDILEHKFGKEYIKYFSSNKNEFVEALKESSSNNKKYHMIVHDESGKDLYARNAVTDFNKDLNIAYQVIRGLNLFTILIVPNILDLDTFFRKRRITGMFWVYDYGKVAFFGKRKMRLLIPALQSMAKGNSNPDPMLARMPNGKKIEPDYLDTYPIYENKEFIKAYEKRKMDNMNSTVNELFDKYDATKKDGSGKSTKEHKLAPMVKKLMKKHPEMSNSQIAKRLRTHPTTVSNIIVAEGLLGDI